MFTTDPGFAVKNVPCSSCHLHDYSCHFQGSGGLTQGATIRSVWRNIRYKSTTGIKVQGNLLRDQNFLSACLQSPMRFTAADLFSVIILSVNFPVYRSMEIVEVTGPFVPAIGSIDSP